MEMLYCFLVLLAIGTAKSELDRLDDMNDDDNQAIPNDVDIAIPTAEEVPIASNYVKLSWPVDGAASNGTFNMTIHEKPLADVVQADNSTNTTRYPVGQGIPFPVGLSLRIRPGTSLVKLLTDGVNLTAITDIDGWMSVDKDASLLSNSAVEAGPVDGTGFAVVKAFPTPKGAMVPIMSGTTLLTVLSNETVLETGHGWHPDIPDVIQRGPGQPPIMQLLAQLAGRSGQ